MADKELKTIHQQLTSLKSSQLQNAPQLLSRAKLALLKLNALIPTTKVIDELNRELFDRREASWGRVTGNRTAPLAAKSMLAELTHSPGSFFMNPVLNLVANGWSYLEISVMNKSRTPFVVCYSYDNDQFTESSEAWDKIRGQLLALPVGTWRLRLRRLGSST